MYTSSTVAPRRCGLSVVARARAALLYALMPYDRSPWESDMARVRA